MTRLILDDTDMHGAFSMAAFGSAECARRVAAEAGHPNFPGRPLHPLRVYPTNPGELVHIVVTTTLWRSTLGEDWRDWR